MASILLLSTYHKLTGIGGHLYPLSQMALGGRTWRNILLNRQCAQMIAL